MKKFVLIPDSFKGTMSSSEICNIMKKAIDDNLSSAEIVSLPVADGGEGTVDAFLVAIGGKKVSIITEGPYRESVESFYGISGETAIVEMAASAGLPMVGDNRCAEKTSTYGVGQLISAAVREPGVKKLIIGLGGSATNDGGCGAAAALGIKFLDKTGAEFVPVGASLVNIDKIDPSPLLQQLKNIEIIIMCDIDNPLCGQNGASEIFGPQKGADPEMVKRLDDGLLHMAKIIKRDLGIDIANLPGAGAAGGMGGGLVAFLNARLQMGIETVLDIVNFENVIENADMILTGEGRIDGQSLHGKVVVGVARRAKVKSVPTVAIVGDISPGAENAYDEGLCGIFTINRLAVPYKESKLTAKDDLYFTVSNLIKYTNSAL